MEAGLQAAGGRGALQLAPERVSPPREPRPVPLPPHPRAPRASGRAVCGSIFGAHSLEESGSLGRERNLKA